MLIGVATVLVTADRISAWETMDEAIKSANSTEKFSGESVHLHFGIIMTKNGLKTTEIGGEGFSVAGILRALSKDDLYRSIDQAHAFKNDSPRSAAILAIANAVLEP